MQVIDKRTNPPELSPICRAIEYVNEYITNGYNQLEAYRKIRPNTTETSLRGNAGRYHKSEAVQQAFDEVISSQLDQYMRSKDGVSIRCQEIMASAETPKDRLACLKFIAELQGMTSKDSININTQVINNKELSKEDRIKIAERIRNNTSIISSNTDMSA